MCDHILSKKELDESIRYLYDLEYRYRQSHNFWQEDISYTCNECNDKWLQLGELLCCPNCKKHVCLACYRGVPKLSSLRELILASDEGSILS
jgi:hypothetical protein